MNLTLAKVVRLPTAAPICASLILFSLFAVAFAFPSAVSAGDTGVSREQQLSQAQAIVSRGERLSVRIGAMKTLAQREKDILRVNCLNTKLAEVNANLRNAKSRLESLRNEVDPQRRIQALTVMLVLDQKLQVLDQQANQCIGQNVFDTTRSNNALDSTDACDSNPCEAGESCKPDSTQPKGYKCESSGSDLAPLPPPVMPDLIVPTSAPNTTVTIMAKGDQQKVMENAETPLTFTVSLDTAASKSLSIPYTISGTDITADDFSGGLTGNVAIAVGESSIDLMLSVKNDDVVEKDETFTITLGPAPEGVTLGDKKSATGTILNDDCKPGYAGDDCDTAIAPSGGTIDSPNEVESEVIVEVSTRDWNAASGNELSYTWSVKCGDEPARKLAETNAKINWTAPKINPGADQTCVISVEAKDTGNAATTTFETTVRVKAPELPLKVELIKPTKTEFNEGDSLEFTVKLNQPAPEQLSYAYSLSNSGDFNVGSTRQFAIDAGQSETKINLTVDDDNILEKDKQFTLTLSGGNIPENSGLPDYSFTGTILDNDEVTVTFSPGNSGQIEVTEGGRFPIRIVVEGELEDINFPVKYSISGEGITSADIEGGLTPEAKYFDGNGLLSIQTKPDDDVESDETFTVTFSDAELPKGVSFSNKQITATIVNDDVNYCADSPCQNGGMCTNKADGYSCSCQQGYSGSDCAVTIAPTAGTVVAEPKEIDSEASTKVTAKDWKSASGSLNFDWSATCGGGLGTGSFADVDNQAEAGGDECAGNPCGSNGTCVDGYKIYSCVCNAGFTGDNCEINENASSGTSLISADNSYKKAKDNSRKWKAPKNTTSEIQTCTITVNGTDPANGIATEPQSIEIKVKSKNLPPVAKDLSVTIEENTTNFSANRVINILSYTDSALDALPDNDKVANEQLRPDIKIVKQPKHGRLSISFVSNDYAEIAEYTPNPNWYGTDAFSYQVTSAVSGLTSNEATTTITVTPVNDPPLAQNDIYTVEEDSVLSVDAANGVLANDTDADADQLTVKWLKDDSRGSQYGPDLEGFKLNADGSFTFKPSENRVGTVRFVYEVTDGKATAKADIDITLKSVNDPPVVKTPLTEEEKTVIITSSLGTTVKIDLNELFYDPDISWTSGKPRIEMEGHPDSLKLSRSGFYSEYTEIVGSLNYSHLGKHDITLTAKDEGGDEDKPYTFTLIVKSDTKPPVYKQIEDQVYTIGQEKGVYINPGDGAFSDPDGDMLTYTVSELPDGLSLSNRPPYENATFIYGKPTKPGDYTITFTADDRKGGITTGSFKLTVKPANKSPVIKNAIADQELKPGERLSVNLMGGSNAVFEDPEGGLLSFTLSGNPSSLSVATGPVIEYEILAGTLTDNDVGQHTITVIAKDSDGAEVSDEFMLTVNSSVFAAQCLAATPIKCPDGRCVMSQTDCDGASAVSERSQSTVVQKEVSVSPDYEETTDSDGNKSLIFTVTLSCPADRPVECSANTCASSAAECPTSVASGCPADKPVKCADNSCAASASVCPQTSAASACPTGYSKCPGPNGACRQTLVDC